MKTSEIAIDKNRYDYLDDGTLKDFIREFLMRNDQFMADYQDLFQSRNNLEEKEKQSEIYKKYKVFTGNSYRRAEHDAQRGDPMIELPLPIYGYRLVDKESMQDVKPYLEKTVPMLLNIIAGRDRLESCKFLDYLERPHIEDAEELLGVLTGPPDKDGYYTCGDTLLLSVRLNYPKEILLKELDGILDIHKARREGNLNMSNWKYCLIIYDLRKTYGSRLTYGEIGDIIINAYPNIKSKEDKHFAYEQRNVENYFKRAKALIYGGYKKYL